MIRKLRKGFTIVELVIVIAVIAVLTAVLIPTFVHLSKKANKASDSSLVANLNTALAMEASESGKAPKTMHEAVEGLVNQGYSVPQLVTKSSEDLVYSIADNKFYLSDADEVKNASKKADFWKIYNSVPAASEQTYSIYAGPTFEATEVEVKVGFDAGYKTGISSVSFIGGNDVIIRTNGGSLTVGTSSEVADCKITHYGALGSAIVYTTVHSFHTHGKISSLELKAGKAVAEDNGYVALVKAAAGTEVEEKDSGTFYIPSNVPVADIDSTVATDLGYKSNGATSATYVIDTESEKGQERAEALNSNAYEIGDKNELIIFRDAVNGGQDFSQLKVVLLRNIDMSGYYWVTPIGTKATPFTGTFDGQTHKIDNLSNAGHKTTETFTNATSQTQGEIFGLFGYVTGSTTIKNLEVDVNASYASGKCWAGLVSASAQNKTGEVSNLVIEKVTIRGELIGKDKVAGFVGQAAPYGATAGSLSIKDSDNYATITASEKRAAGFVSSIGATKSTKISDVSFTNCHNYGTITGPSMVGGIVGLVNQSDQDVWDIYKNSVTGTQTWLDVANSSATFRYSECTSTATVSSGRLFNDTIVYGKENVGSVSENFGNKMYAKVHASYFNNISIDGSAVADWNTNDIYRYLAGLAYEEDKTIIAKVAAGDVVRTYVSEYTYGSLQGFNAVLNDNYFKNGSTITLEQDLLLTDNGESYYSLWSQSGSPTINFNGHDIASSSFELCIRSSSIVLSNLMNGKVKVYTNVAPTINGVKFEAVSSGPVVYEYVNGNLVA